MNYATNISQRLENSLWGDTRPYRQTFFIQKNFSIKYHIHLYWTKSSYSFNISTKHLYRCMVQSLIEVNDNRFFYFPHSTHNVALPEEEICVISIVELNNPFLSLLFKWRKLIVRRWLIIVIPAYLFDIPWWFNWLEWILIRDHSAIIPSEHPARTNRCFSCELSITFMSSQLSPEGSYSLIFHHYLLVKRHKQAILNRFISCFGWVSIHISYDHFPY